MLPPRSRWKLAEMDDTLAAQISAQCNIHPLIARLLVIRGIHTPEQAERFLYADEKEMYDPFFMDGMHEAVDRIQSAIRNREKIRIYGDYDADGVCSTAILARLLQRMQADFDFYVPHRIKEGYGLNVEAIEQAKQEGVSLIITVDNGISAKEEIEHASRLGIDVVVTDHHEPPPELPHAAIAVVNPKKPGCSYPFKELAGAGIAYKLAVALSGQAEPEWQVLAAIGTIADLVPLTDENRILAKCGLEAIKRADLPGVRSLIHVSGSRVENCTEMTIAFQIAPRLNAGGRMSDAEPAVRLLMTEDEQEADMLARMLDDLNRERQKQVEAMTEEAFRIVEHEQQADDRVIVVARPGWNVGVVGIVASKIVQKTNRPAVVLTIDETTQMAKGSARSIEAFDFHRALTACADLLEQFGGHRAAGGMTLQREKIAEFRKRLNMLAHEWLDEQDFVPTSHADLECSLHEISEDVIEMMDQLAPFGTGNPSPRFVFRNMSVREKRRLGERRNHLKLVLQPSETKLVVTSSPERVTESFSNSTLEAIAFDRGMASDWISPFSTLHVYGEIGINEWNGIRKRQLIVEDLCITEPQIFDWRQLDDVEEKLRSWFKERRDLGLHRSPVLIFGKMGFSDGDWQEQNVVWIDPDRISSMDRIRSIESAVERGHAANDLILYALPASADDLKRLVTSLKHLERIYVIFRDGWSALKPLPERETFKRVYIALKKDSTWTADSEKMQLAAKKLRVDAEQISFILNVFEELELIRRIDSTRCYECIPTSGKRNLEQSVSYRSRKAQREWVQHMMGASGEKLSRWLVELLGRHIEGTSAEREAAAYLEQFKEEHEHGF